MGNIGELGIGVKVDEPSLKSATKKIQTDFKKTGDNVENDFTNRTKKGISGISSSLGGLGGILAGAFSIAGIATFTKSLFSLGSDLEEIGSKFDVVFKGSDDVKNKFKEMADATNRSNLDLITFGSSIGNVLAPMGLAQTEVDGLSVGLTKLAIDVASFNNVSDAQAVGAFTTALTGEREALKSLGIVISQADVSNKAYKLGLAETGQELTKQQTALATYQLLLENTSNAHGDAVRTGASFANQLKGLRGAIKDVFANAGKDVAGQTAGLLKGITVFISSYGGAIISTMVDTGKIVGGAIKDLMKAFATMFSFISSGTDQQNDDMQGTAFVFMKVVQGFGTGVKLIATFLKTLVNFTAIQIGIFVEIFMFAFNSVGDAWNILRTVFVGSIKSIVDISQLGAGVIGEVFVGMAEAIVEVFKALADNVSVAVKKASNLAISGINGFIEIANKIPGVDIKGLIPFGDADFKGFSLSVGKNISAIKGKFDQFGQDISGNYAGVSASFSNIGNNFKNSVGNVVAVSSGAFSDMGDDWSNFATEVQASSDNITKKLADGANKQKDNAKKYDEGYFSILDLIDKYKGGVEKGEKASKQAGDTAKKTIDLIKKEYAEWEKKVEDLNKANKKLSEDTQKYNEDIKDSIRALGKELEDITKKYQDAVAEINASTGEDIASRGVDIAKDLLETEKNIADIKSESTLDEEAKKQSILDLEKKMSLLSIKIGENTVKTSASTKESQKLTMERYRDQLKILQSEGVSVENQQKLTDLEAQKTALLKEQAFIIENTTEAQRTEATRRAGLSESEKIQEDSNLKIEAQTKEFEAEKAKNESLQKINTYFAGLKSLNQAGLDKVMADQRFLAMSKEEQELILKLGREKIELTNQRDAVIQMQTDIKNATVALSDEATAVQMANIGTLKGEYATLISQIQNAISKQRELNAVKSQTRGFANGGYTGSGGKNEVAGVVHKGEWVAPKWMVNSMKPLFDSLEGARGRGFADGGYTNTVNKTQNNTITVNSGADLKGFMDYAKWKM